MIVYIAMSLDGYIADKDGGVSWLDDYNDQDNFKSYENFYKNIDTVIMGSKTYNQVINFDVEYPYQNVINYIITNQKEKYKNNKEKYLNFINLEELPKNLNNDKTWIIGGSSIINQLFEENKITKIYLNIIPLILGSGIKMFEYNKEKKFNLIKINKVKNIVELQYEILK